MPGGGSALEIVEKPLTRRGSGHRRSNIWMLDDRVAIVVVIFGEEPISDVQPPTTTTCLAD